MKSYVRIGHKQSQTLLKIESRKWRPEFIRRKFGVNKFGINKLDISRFDVSKFDISKFDISKFDSGVWIVYFPCRLV